MSFKIESGIIQLCKDPEIIVNDNDKLKAASYFSEGLGIAKDEDSGLYGFLNLKGEIEIPCKYRRAYGFSEGLATVQDAKTGLWGSINKKGKEVIPCKFSEPYHFREGLASIKINNLILGCIDKNGKLVISTHKYWFISFFSEGLAVVQDSKTGLYGYIDKNGHEVIPCIYNDAQAFSEDMACVTNRNYIQGYIDKSGILKIPYQYSQAKSFKNGLAWVESKRKTEYYINKQSEKLKLENRNLRPTGDFSEGFATVEKKSSQGLLDFYYINTDGKIVFANYQPCSEFQDGFAFVIEKNARKNIFINTEGKPKNETKYLKAVIGGYETENGIIIAQIESRGPEVVLNSNLDVLFQVKRYYLRIFPGGKTIFFNTKEQLEKAVKELEKTIKIVSRYSDKTKKPKIKDSDTISYLIDEQTKDSSYIKNKI